MAKEKHYIFSARTTEEGLRQLSRRKVKLNVGWDDLVVDTVCEKYGLEKATMALLRKEKPANKAADIREPKNEQTTKVQPAATHVKKPAKKKAERRILNEPLKSMSKFLVET